MLARATIAILIGMTASALAWEGEDTATGATVEIDKGTLVRDGESIDVYDYDKGEYRTIDIDDIQSSGSGAIIEGTDAETGESVEFEME